MLVEKNPPKPQTNTSTIASENVNVNVNVNVHRVSNETRQSQNNYAKKFGTKSRGIPNCLES